LAGFGTLLRPLLGVALLPRPPAGAGEASEVWSPRVRALSLVDEDDGLLGTLYVDPAGGYGTRMLRHGPWPQTPLFCVKPQECSGRQTGYRPWLLPREEICRPSWPAIRSG
jgi:hypothetical protein